MCLDAYEEEDTCMSYEEEDVFHVCGRANQTAASVCARRGLLLLSACMPACVCVCARARARRACLSIFGHPLPDCQ
jgi:hypothetical protein